MKIRFSKLLFLTITLLFATACAGGKDVLFEPDPPFTLKSVYYQDWIAGTQRGGAGTVVTVYMGSVSEEMRLLNIYFLDQVRKAEQDRRNLDKYTGHFSKDMNTDRIMDINPKEEAHNTPPLKSPFILDEGEVVLGYLHEGEQKFYKVPEVTKKPMIAYPGTKPDGLN